MRTRRRCRGDTCPRRRRSRLRSARARAAVTVPRALLLLLLARLIHVCARVAACLRYVIDAAGAVVPRVGGPNAKGKDKGGKKGNRGMLSRLHLL